MAQSAYFDEPPLVMHPLLCLDRNLPQLQVTCTQLNRGCHSGFVSPSCTHAASCTSVQVQLFPRSPHVKNSQLATQICMQPLKPVACKEVAARSPGSCFVPHGMGLCRERKWDLDLICPVPDGSRPAAIQMAADMALPYREGLVKNRYVGRTFIMPNQRLREMSVRRKLNAMSTVFKGG
eukprot:scaffold9819_cov21-Tisochrysis_lutea.AAC.5